MDIGFLGRFSLFLFPVSMSILVVIFFIWGGWLLRQTWANAWDKSRIMQCLVLTVIWLSLGAVMFTASRNPELSTMEDTDPFPKALFWTFTIFSWSSFIGVPVLIGGLVLILVKLRRKEAETTDPDSNQS